MTPGVLHIGRGRRSARRAVLVAVLVAVASALVADAAVAEAPTPSERPSRTWVPNAATAALRVGDTIYLGGVSRLSPRSGAGAAFDLSGRQLGGWAELEAPVTAAVGDGQGGFYVAAAESIVHLRADGSKDAAFVAARTPDVEALALSGRRLYLGGGFAAVGATARRHAAAIDAVTGAVLRWNPRPNGPVHALAVSGRTVFLGGDFGRAGGASRGPLAAVDALSGHLRAWKARIRAPDWHLRPDPSVNALLVLGRTLYVGGYFDRVARQRRDSLAALDVGNARLRAWAPRLAATNENAPEVFALAADSARVYVGGLELRGPYSEVGLLAFARAGGKLEWRGPKCDANSLLRAGERLLVAGEIRGGARIAALDPRTGRRTSWNPQPNDSVAVLARSGRTTFAGGSFTGLGGLIRSGLAALDARTGTPTGWDPGPNGRVTAIIRDGDTIYFGGYFTKFGGTRHTRVAAVRAATGQILDWNGEIPPGDSAIPPATSLAVADGKLFAGGRYGVVAVDLATRATTSWPIAKRAANSWDTVDALAASGRVVYVAGSFRSIGGVRRSGLAALDARTGAVLPWNPALDGNWSALAVDDDTVYAGRTAEWYVSDPGDAEVAAIPAAGGPPRWRIHATLPPIPIDPDDIGPGLLWPAVDALALDGQTLYVGGIFATLAGADRSHAGALDAATGRALAWHPALQPFALNPAGVTSITVSSADVILAGAFTGVADLPQSSFAQFEFAS